MLRHIRAVSLAGKAWPERRTSFWRDDLSASSCAIVRCKEVMLSPARSECRCAPLAVCSGAGSWQRRRVLARWRVSSIANWTMAEPVFLESVISALSSKRMTAGGMRWTILRGWVPFPLAGGRAQEGALTAGQRFLPCPTAGKITGAHQTLVYLQGMMNRLIITRA